MDSPERVEYNAGVGRIRLRRGGPLHLGMNYRLQYGYDFDSGALGIRNPDRLALLHADFAMLAAHGVEVVRWFVLNDGRLRDGGVSPGAIAESLVAGLDAAQSHGIAVIPVLLDHTFCFEAEPAGPGRTKQGHAADMKDGDRFLRLLEEQIEPLLAASGRHPAVLGYELMNEPEMAMRRRDWPFSPPTGVGCGKVPKPLQLTVGEMRERMSLCASAVARHSDAAFSVGSMSSRWVGQWERVLDPTRDFLTFHYYGEAHERDLHAMIERRLAPIADRIAFGFGEFYPNGRRSIPPGRAVTPWPDYSLSDFLDAARRFRFQIAMPWVWNPGEHDPGAIPMAEWARWREARA